MHRQFLDGVKGRNQAVASAQKYLTDGGFAKDLGDLVAVKTESSKRDDHDEKYVYLREIIGPKMAALGFRTETFENPDPLGGPLALLVRSEEESLPTVLMYGHADVVPGLEGHWDKDRSPWRLDEEDGKLFGRGTADNKGQHWINFSALREVLSTRGRLGFNCKILLETDEESGSRGLEDFCRTHKQQLSADVLIASDGPRIRADRPTVALGSRGNLNFDLSVRYRSVGRHSGNWGGLIKDPGIRLSHAIATIADAQGRILVEAWRPNQPDKRIRELLRDCPVQSGPDDESLDPDWGETDLFPAERVFAWNNFAVIAMKCGFPERPVNAIAPSAWARCQLRFVAGLDPDDILPELRKHLDKAGFQDVQLTLARTTCWRGTTTDLDNEWIRLISRSIERSTGALPDLIPSIGGSLPNYAFSELVGMPTVWLPHSYNQCSQHAPNEHLRLDIVANALKVTTGLFWDLGEHGSGDQK